MSQKLDESISKINSGLEKVSIQRIGKKLYLRATLPPKTGEGRWKQQRIALGIAATGKGVREAQRKAIALQDDLIDSGEAFDWGSWLPDVANKGTARYWIEKFEQDFWKRNEKTLNRVEYFKVAYLNHFKHLDGDQPLSLTPILNYLRSKPNNSAIKHQASLALGALAKFAEFSHEDLEAIKGERGTYRQKKGREIDPNTLPSDDLIEQFYDIIPNPTWQWIYGMIATYGLRPHEAFRCYFKEGEKQDNTLWIEENTKTGVRFVFPFHPEWVEKWSLKNKRLPNVNLEVSNTRLGETAKVTFTRYDMPFHAYALRHSYARRLLEYGVHPDMGATLMGHSVDVHCKTYQRMIGLETYQKVYRKLIQAQ